MEFVIIEAYGKTGKKAKALVNLNRVNFMSEQKEDNSLIEEYTIIDFEGGQIRTVLSIDEILKLASKLEF